MSTGRRKARGRAARIFGPLAYCPHSTTTKAICKVAELCTVVLTISLAAISGCLNRGIAAAFLQPVDFIARIMNGAY